MKLSPKGENLLHQREGLRLKPYLDTRGKPTIGYGNTYYEDGSAVTMKDPAITAERAASLYRNIVVEFEDAVNRLVEVDLSQNQYDALVSFAYNVGIKALSTSTLLRKLNAGDYKGAANEFKNWRKSGGKVDNGLINRRRGEETQFNQPD